MIIILLNVETNKFLIFMSAQFDTQYEIEKKNDKIKKIRYSIKTKDFNNYYYKLTKTQYKLSLHIL